MNSFFLLATIAAFSLATTSCAKKEDSANLKVNIQATNKTFSLPVAGGTVKSSSATPSITWISGSMFVSKLEFEAKKGKSSGDAVKTQIKYEWKGPVSVDIFNSSSMFGNITLPFGYYDEIELSVHLSKTDAAGTPVIKLTGNYTNASAVVIPVVFTSFEDVNFKSEKAGATITAESGSGFSTFIQVYLDAAMAGLTLQQLDSAVLTNGTLQISATSNPALYTTMFNNLEKSHHFELAKD